MLGVVTLLIIVLVCGCTARLTRLITDDRITLPVRQAVIRSFGPDHWFTFLIMCPWCVSPYVAFLTAIPAIWWGLDFLPLHVRFILTILTIPTASQVAGIIQGKE